MTLAKTCPKPMLRARLKRTLGICCGSYLLVCTGCASFQRRMIYFPPVLPRERVDQLATAADLERWMSPSGKPVGWKRLMAGQPSQGKVLITHGNACCAYQCSDIVSAIQQIAALDVFIVEYPGYADRPGKPSESSLYESADEAFQLLAANGPVYLVGESLGTGVASYLAGLHPDQVAGVALLAPFNSLTDVAQAHAPILPVHLILCDRFPSEKHLSHYHGPVAMLVGGQDNVVPPKFGRRLYEGYSGPKRLWEFPEGNHGTVRMQPPPIWQEVVEFWRAVH